MRSAVQNGLCYRFHCDAVVIHETPGGRPELFAASIAGATAAIKAFRASVGSGRHLWPSFDWTPDSGHGRTFLAIPESGVRLSQPHRLDYGLAQISFVARMPNLLTSRYPETVWQYLDKSTTTPLKREWMPFVIDTLKDAGKIVTPKIQHNLSMALCYVDDDTLDKIIRSGIKHGRIAI